MKASWIGFRQAEASLALNDIGTSLTRERLLLQLLDELGFGGLSLVRSLAIKDEPGDRTASKDYAISHVWTGCVPIQLMGWRVGRRLTLGQCRRCLPNGPQPHN